MITKQKSNFLSVSFAFLVGFSVMFCSISQLCATEWILYGVAHKGPDGPSTLYAIDTSNGHAVAVGPIGFERCSAIDYDEDSGILYATCERNDGSDEHVLISIDNNTGAGTEIGPTGVEDLLDSNTAPDISFRNFDSKLFAYAIWGDVLATIDLSTGEMIQTGDPTGALDFCFNACGYGLAFSPLDVLFLAVDLNLLTLDHTTSELTEVATLQFNLPPEDEYPRINGMDFHPETGTLFGSVRIGFGNLQKTTLATVDTTTGVVTIIGPTVAGLDALAFGPPLTVAADAGPDQTVECTSSSGASVTLDGSGSSGNPLTYTWTGPFGTVTGVNPTVNMPSGGVSTVLLTVDDGTDSDSDEVIITVEDTTEPDVAAELVPVKLKKKKGCFRVEFTATDICDVDPDIVAVLNGYPVTNGQLVELKHKKKFKVKTPDNDGSSGDRKKKLKKHHGDDKSSDDGSSDDGKNNKKNKKKKHHDDGSSDDESSDDSSSGSCGDVKLEGHGFTLEVTATDDAGNAGAAVDIYFFDTSKKKDDDGDGYANNQGDCDDTDPTINPDAKEVCDGKDNDCDGQIDEPEIHFTSPVDGSTINSSNTIVTGTINACFQEVGILVNGVLAEIAGSEFAANDIFLEIGVNTLIAVATDKDGNTTTATITVYTSFYEDLVNLFTNVTSGISPLNVKFSIDTQISNQIATYEMDFEGDGVIDQTIVDPDNVSFTYNQEGIYYPTITVTDDQDYQYTDTIAITVLSLDKMDALFNAKWGGMKSALINGDIEGALEPFDESFREVYREQFTELSSILDTIGNELGYIRLVAIGDNRAEYEIIVTRDGSTYSFYLLFVRDQNGLWKVKAF